MTGFLFDEARMSRIISSAEMVEKLTEATMQGSPEREKHIFRQALHAMVAMAKAEKLLELRLDVAKAVGNGVD